MKKFIVRWIANALAMGAAYLILNGKISLTPGKEVVTIIVLALIFGLVNAIVRPLVKVLTCPIVLLTLGLATLVINTLMFLLANWIGDLVGYSFQIDKPQFWYAFLGALIVSVVSFLISGILGENTRHTKTSA